MLDFRVKRVPRLSLDTSVDAYLLARREYTADRSSMITLSRIRRNETIKIVAAVIYDQEAEECSEMRVYLDEGKDFFVHLLSYFHSFICL